MAMDFELKEHILKHARSFVADGGSNVRQALFLAVGKLFPNVVIIFLDAAHALRISCESQLRFDEFFSVVWEELFNKRHALVPDIMNSDKWQSLFSGDPNNCRENPV